MKKILKVFIYVVFVLLIAGCKKNVNKTTVQNSKIGNLSFSVPVEFAKDKNNASETSAYYSYTSSDGKESCFVGVFESVVTSDDLDKLAKDNLYGTGDTSVSDKTINNQNWKVAIAKNGETLVNYSYVTIYNKKSYIVTYNNLGNGNFCNTSQDTIINSLKFEK